MSISRTFSKNSSGERIITIWLDNEAYARIIRRNGVRRYDVEFLDADKKGIYGCKSRSEAEMALF